MGEEPAEPAVEIIHEIIHAARAGEPPPAAEVEFVEITGAGRRDESPADRSRGLHLGPTGTLGRFAETVMSAGITGVRTLVSASGRMAHLVAVSPVGRVVSDVAAGVAAAVTDDTGIDWALAGRRAEERLSRVIAVVVPVVAESIDPETIVERIDVNALMDQVDIDGLLGRVDVNAMLEGVDVNALLDRVDVNALLDRVDVDALLSRADVDALLGRVDVDALIERVDIDEIVKRVQVGDILGRGTGEGAGSAIDLARRQGVGLDVVLSRTVNRLIGRDPDRMPIGPQGLLLPDEEEDTEAQEGSS